jgi:hypothetical protein
MIRLFKHYVPYAVLFLALVDLCLLLVAAETAWVIRANQIGMHVDYIGNRIWPLVTFAAAVQLAAMAVGVYSAEALQSLRFAVARLIVAVSLGVIFMAIMAFALPGMTLVALQLALRDDIVVRLSRAQPHDFGEPDRRREL